MEEILVVFEEGVNEAFNEQFQFFNGETLGLLDIVVAATSCTYKAFQEACDIEVFTLEKMPKFFMWVNVNALKETLSSSWLVGGQTQKHIVDWI